MSTRIPKYRKHRTGRARVAIQGKTYYLGKHGTPGSRQKYRTLIQEWLTKTGRFALDQAEPAIQSSSAGTTVNDVALSYIKHAEEYYRENPKEVEKVKLSVRRLRKLYGHTMAAAFDCLALEAVQNDMIESGLARSTINERIRVLKRLFRWGARKKIVPAAVNGELLTVEGLKRGRTKARETEPIKPVPQEHIDVVLPLVNQQLRSLIRLQLLTAARPGEICMMRRSDLDTNGQVWVYRPRKHKNLYRGHSREIYLVPQAQELVTDFFQPELYAFLFSPRQTREERYSSMRAKRKTKWSVSQITSWLAWPPALGSRSCPKVRRRTF